ncbi:MAG: CocE/NonD family hydrolase [Planctomycetia bacterium]|nr:CocE/NonD family hydrolase [Planctomycetia bacterium]
MRLQQRRALLSILVVGIVLGMGEAPGQNQVAEINKAELAKCLAKLPAGTRHEHLMMPLRDGVKLATDVFRPAEGDGPWPVMLLRTPYSRFDPRPVSEMDKEPCVLVVQNQRGRYGSEGTPPRDTFINEVEDGYDAIEWCAKQKWCNGKVAMWGPSGHGISPTNAVWSKAPHLVAVNVNITGDDAYLHWCFNNGACRAFYTWMGQRNQKVTDWPRPTTIPYDWKARQAFLAKQAADNKVYYVANAGWYDLFSEGALDAFAALAPNGRAFVSMTPGGHGPIGGDLKYPSPPRPKDAPFPTTKQLMMGQKPRTARSALVYYLMGDTQDKAAPGNIWKVSHTWPVPHTPTDYFLRTDGTLSTQKPDDKKASLTFTYDPKDPAPSLGGNYAIGAKSGPLDQRPAKDRKDILRFISAPLAEPVGITGKVWADLHFTSDAADTMFVVKLVDIYPDGYEAMVRESAGLARYHQGLDRPAAIEPGKTYALQLDLWSTALVFNKGHRIGVYVTSSSKEAYEVHPNTFEPVKSIDGAKMAKNTIHLSAEHPSKVILPVIAPETYLPERKGAADPGQVDRLKQIGARIQFDDQQRIIGVNLGERRLADADLANLQGLDHLQELDLTRTRITSAGLVHLQGLTSLKKLFLTETPVDDAGIGSLKGMKSLEVLGLSGTKVGDSALAQLEALPGLRSLFCIGTGVTDARVEKLQKALPQCRVTH